GLYKVVACDAILSQLLEHVHEEPGAAHAGGVGAVGGVAGLRRAVLAEHALIRCDHWIAGPLRVVDVLAVKGAGHAIDVVTAAGGDDGAGVDCGGQHVGDVKGRLPVQLGQRPHGADPLGRNGGDQQQVGCLVLQGGALGGDGGSGRL